MYHSLYQTSYEWRVQKVCVLSLSLNFCNALKPIPYKSFVDFFSSFFQFSFCLTVNNDVTWLSQHMQAFENNYFASTGRYAFEAVLNNKTDTEYKYIWLVAIIGYRTIFHNYRQWPSSPIIPKLHEPAPKLVERLSDNTCCICWRLEDNGTSEEDIAARDGVFIHKEPSNNTGIPSNVIDTIVHTAHYRKIFSSQLGFQCIVAAKQAYIID
ncbi:hypothetical protein GQX74_005168 [Glossina fuscipes]|nr:hypothetical protein GQX74_005168 [Glossina fuscipes]